jgi:hypothetical protein
MARSAALGAVMMGFAAGSAAQSAELTFPVDETVSRFVMPITPYVFDLIVQSTRYVAEITYDQRGYDAVTNTLFVKGLHIKRDTLDLEIGRMRFDLGSLLLENFVIDTRALDLPPPVVDVLRKAGRDKLEGDMMIAYKSNGSRSGYQVTMRYDLDGIAALAGQASIDDFHVLIPIGDALYGDVSNAQDVTGALVSATIGYEDKGLMKLALAAAAEQQNISPDQLKDFLVNLPRDVAMRIVGSISGGASPELSARIMGWATIVEGFIKDEDAIRVTLSPAEPIPLQRLIAAQELDEALILALNPTVTRGFAVTVPPPAAPGSVAEGAMLISGAGAPQNREEGARKLIALAATGDLNAVRALGDSFGETPVPALEAGEAASLYAYLLVARALDKTVADGTLTALTAKLGRDAVLAAENDAITYFEKNGGGPLHSTNPADYDANDLRALAYDYYEGRGLPRNFTRALTLALIASAAGDPFAADLRDDLVAAADRNEIAINLTAARNDAEQGWKGYQAAHPGTAGKP